MARKRRSSRTRAWASIMPKEDIRAIDDPFALTKSVYIHDAPTAERRKRYGVVKHALKR